MKLEICIGLTPVQSLSEKLVGLSQELAQQSDAGDVVLQLQQGDRRLTVAPHLTLYQAAFPVAKLERVAHILKKLSAETAFFDLEGSTFSHNTEEGSAEIKYTPNKHLIALQMRVVKELNDLRDDLDLDQNPAGVSVSDLKPRASQRNLREFGFPEYGAESFNPHVTLSWLGVMEGSTNAYNQLTSGEFVYAGSDEPVDAVKPGGMFSNFLGSGSAANSQAGDAPAEGVKPETFSGVFESLGIFVMGPQGSCPQRINSFKLTQKPQRLKFPKPEFMGVGMHTIEFPGTSHYPMVNQLLPGGFSEKLGIEIGMAIIEINGQSMRGEGGKQCKEVIKSIPKGKIMQMSVQRGRPWPQQRAMVYISPVKAARPASTAQQSKKSSLGGRMQLNPPGVDTPAGSQKPAMSALSTRVGTPAVSTAEKPAVSTV